jgi:hypothetical protein
MRRHQAHAFIAQMSRNQLAATNQPRVSAPTIWFRHSGDTWRALPISASEYHSESEHDIQHLNYGMKGL